MRPTNALVLGLLGLAPLAAGLPTAGSVDLERRYVVSLSIAMIIESS